MKRTAMVVAIALAGPAFLLSPALLEGCSSDGAEQPHPSASTVTCTDPQNELKIALRSERSPLLENVAAELSTGLTDDERSHLANIDWRTISEAEVQADSVLRKAAEIAAPLVHASCPAGLAIRTSNRSLIATAHAAGDERCLVAKGNGTAIAVGFASVGNALACAATGVGAGLCVAGLVIAYVIISDSKNACASVVPIFDAALFDATADADADASLNSDRIRGTWQGDFAIPGCTSPHTFHIFARASDGALSVSYSSGTGGGGETNIPGFLRDGALNLFQPPGFSGSVTSLDVGATVSGTVTLTAEQYPPNGLTYAAPLRKVADTTDVPHVPPANGTGCK